MFESESALVNAYQAYLQARGIPTRAEVPCGKGGFSADLVSQSVVWEAKLILDRNGLYQALGQVESYRQYLKLPKSAIFGLLPEVSAKQAERIAEWLRERHSHLWILFVDQDPAFIRFCEKYQLFEVNNNVREVEKTVKLKRPSPARVR